MSGVWFCIPSIRPGGGTIPAWRRAGYRIAVLRQGEPLGPAIADIEIPTAEYLGWPKSINILSRSVFERDPDAQWIVSGGDDYLPDTEHIPECIGVECRTHFGGTFGVMQPTGDRWGEEWPQKPEWAGKPAVLDRIAGSPWLGREWCERAYGGRGPMPEEYHHVFADEQLQCVAERLGVFWQRRDLCQYHAHPLRKPHARQEDWPEFLKPIQAMWSREQARFDADKAAGFPGSDPLPDGVK
jgi:hypothetical protein